MKFEKRNNINYEESAIINLSKDLNVSLLTAKILCERGYSDTNNAKEYLGLNGMRFSNPFDICGMNEAVNKINEAIKLDKKIVIYSDYDADGVCACSIFMRKLKQLGYKNYTFYTPQRESEGYGMNMTAIKSIKNDGGELIITVDCGISNDNEISYAKELGLDVIVTDHHNCPPQLPECIIVNPKLGSSKGQENLCGAAVAMKVCQAFGGGSSFNEGMELAAIASVADMMPLIGENKHIVNKGLDIINNRPSAEIAALNKACFDKENIDASDIAFKLGPVINAAGRVASAHLCIELLSGISNDSKKTAQTMVEYNENRKQIERNVYKDAISMLENEDLSKRISIVLFNENWPLGVVGIAASKLMNTFGRPVVLLSLGDGKIKGSLRGIDGINIFDVLSKMPDLFEQFGGHSKAAGITLKDGMFEKFKKLFDEEMRKYDKKLFDHIVYYDCEVNSSDINLDVISELSKMEPFGQGNPKIDLFLKDQHVVDYRTMGKEHNHYSATFKDSFGQVKCTSFFSSLPDSAIKSDMVCDVIACPVKNVWNGYSSARGMVETVNPYFKNKTSYVNYINKIDNNFISSTVEEILLGDEKSLSTQSSSLNNIKQSIKNSDYSTLIIVAQSENAIVLYDELGEDVIKNLNIATGLLDKSTRGKNTLLLAPVISKLQSKWFNSIFYVTSLKRDKIVKKLSKSLHDDIQMVIMGNINSYDLKLINKKRLREIYLITRTALLKNDKTNLLLEHSTLGVHRYEMQIAINIFMEVGLLEQKDNKDYYKIVEQTKVEIEKAKAYILFTSSNI